MGIIKIQTSKPQIKMYHIDTNELYQTFSPDSVDTGKNLINYSFQKSLKTVTGSFSMTVKENVKMADDKRFLNKVKTFDVVEIYENGELDFRGIITSISYTADASSLTKTISIQGRSIMWLLESLNLNTELTAMIVTDNAIQKEAEDITLKTQLNNGNSTVVKDALKTIYKAFCDVIKKNTALSNSGLIAYINKWISNDFIDIPLYQGKELKFYLPLVTSFFSRDVVTYLDYIRGFLDSNIYEMYEVIEDGKVKLRIRDCPFDKEDWINIPKMDIFSSTLTNYTITKSIDEVYTSFYAAVEGSRLTPEYFIHAGQTGCVVENEEKKKIYGYKPLRATFTGYTTSSKTTIDEEKFTQLAKRFSKWYDHLDEFYTGTITVINIHNQKKARIGEKISFLNGEFYVVGEDHQWSYGNSPKIIYHVERGGKYSSSGEFSQLKNISRNIAELESAETLTNREEKWV